MSCFRRKLQTEALFARRGNGCFFIIFDNSIKSSGFIFYKLLTFVSKNSIIVTRTGLGKLHMCVRDVLDIINFTNYRSWLFLWQVRSRTHPFSFLSMWSSLKKLHKICTLDFKNNNRTFYFHFMFNVLHVMIWNFIIIFEKYGSVCLCENKKIIMLTLPVPIPDEEKKLT